tara:strand:- start:484 stop:747 length:264 start_codon:yes stop_codon:yes gene_type:complete
MGKYKYDHLGHKLYKVPGVKDDSKIVEIKLDPKATTLNAIKRLNHPEMKAQGGSMKKKKKFPDLSGDGKITQKDILMAKGVIKKRKK